MMLKSEFRAKLNYWKIVTQNMKIHIQFNKEFSFDFGFKGIYSF